MIHWQTVKEFEDITHKKCNGVARIGFDEVNKWVSVAPMGTL